MVTTTTTKPEQSTEARRERSKIPFPSYSLADSVAVARALHGEGGGKATSDHLAALLGYKSTANGAYLARVGAARMFGTINKHGEFFVVTALGNQILMPTYPNQEREGLINAFFNVALFKRVFDEYKGKELPTEVGMKNALRNIFGVVVSRTAIAFRVLMDSADTAGFFSVRGSRTHLIMPPLKPASSPSAQSQSNGSSNDYSGTGGAVDGHPAEESASASGGGAGTPRQIVANQSVKDRYIQTLINALEEKSKKGELDEALMTRIEKLLQLQ